MGVNIYIENENAGLFDTLSSTTRLEIIRLLSEKPHNIVQIAEKLGISPPVVSKHVKMLVDNGIVSSDFEKIESGRQRMCYLKENKITIHLKSTKYCKVQTMHIPIGDYARCIDVQPPCGLSIDTEIRGIEDDPRYFVMPGREELTHIWFSNGVLKYNMPNTIGGTAVRAVTVKLVASAFCHNNDSDYGTVYFSFCEKIFCNIKIDPQSDEQEYVVRLDKNGVLCNGEQVSDVGIDSYKFDTDHFTFEIGAGYKNGVKTVLNLYAQPDIEITVESI